ncbi:hypothetical protein BCR32DRAFT_298406 [Anaeromyces robustus]|uniref:Secreted protein n=1 Tax=Anaeromyces robustus TaxID=1754192 RepID=A0A1Y1VR43_9FUNG|nr:hypothetical protein BCR32DRAFT_298406 [Anaeromyces robustus]|eukprot:ORX63506.1 hypothetical protein BCR32DRAFT_298406 [Anaeromyces robustus]
MFKNIIIKRNLKKMLALFLSCMVSGLVTDAKCVKACTGNNRSVPAGKCIQIDFDILWTGKFAQCGDSASLRAEARDGYRWVCNNDPKSSHKVCVF